MMERGSALGAGLGEAAEAIGEGLAGLMEVEATGAALSALLDDAPDELAAAVAVGGGVEGDGVEVVGKAGRSGEQVG